MASVRSSCPWYLACWAVEFYCKWKFIFLLDWFSVSQWLAQLSQKLLIVWLTWWNVLVTQWLTDNLYVHNHYLNDSGTIKLIDVIDGLIMWCAHHCKERIFFARFTVFLNCWLNVTASDAVKCLTDLVKCIIK